MSKYHNPFEELLQNSSSTDSQQQPPTKQEVAQASQEQQQSVSFDQQFQQNTQTIEGDSNQERPPGISPATFAAGQETHPEKKLPAPPSDGIGGAQLSSPARPAPPSQPLGTNMLSPQQQQQQQQQPTTPNKQNEPVVVLSPPKSANRSTLRRTLKQEKSSGGLNHFAESQQPTSPQQGLTRSSSGIVAQSPMRSSNDAPVRRGSISHSPSLSRKSDAAASPAKQQTAAPQAATPHAATPQAAAGHYDKLTLSIPEFCHGLRGPKLAQIPNVLCKGDELSFRVSVGGISVDANQRCHVAVKHVCVPSNGEGKRLSEHEFVVQKMLPFGSGNVVELYVSTSVSFDFEVGPYALQVGVQDALSGKTLSFSHQFEVKDWCWGLYQAKLLVEGKPGITPVYFVNQDISISAVVTLPKSEEAVDKLEAFYDIRDTSNNSILQKPHPLVVISSFLCLLFFAYNQNSLRSIQTGQMYSWFLEHLQSVEQGVICFFLLCLILNNKRDQF